MASNRNKMIEKLGSEDAYKAYMRSLADKSSRRTGKKDTVESLTKRIYVVADQEGVEVKVEVKRK